MSTENPASSGACDMLVRCAVNGRDHEAVVPVRRLLSDFLRHDLGLTGTHVGCEHGVCGACTVLVDGRPRRSCLTLAVQVDGTTVTTIEGLRSPGGSMHPVMQAFIDNHGLQCGFCTPGFVILAYALLQENALPSRAQIREGLAGNICRCTGYLGIIDAVEAARDISTARSMEE